MDLNHLFSQHQRALIMMDHGSCDATRAGYRGTADRLAGAIGEIRAAMNATGRVLAPLAKPAPAR